MFIRPLAYYARGLLLIGELIVYCADYIPHVFGSRRSAFLLVCNIASGKMLHIEFGAKSKMDACPFCDADLAQFHLDVWGGGRSSYVFRAKG